MATGITSVELLKLSAGPAGVTAAERLIVIGEDGFCHEQLTSIALTAYGAALFVLSVTLPDGQSEKSSAYATAPKAASKRALQRIARVMASPSRTC